MSEDSQNRIKVELVKFYISKAPQAEGDVNVDEVDEHASRILSEREITPSPLLLVMVPKTSIVDIELFNQFCAAPQITLRAPFEWNDTIGALFPATPQVLEQMISFGIIDAEQAKKLEYDLRSPDRNPPLLM